MYDQIIRKLVLMYSILLLQELNTTPGILIK